MFPNVKSWCWTKIRQRARAIGSVNEFSPKFLIILLIFTGIRGIHLLWCSNHISSDVARIQLNNISWFILSEVPLELGGRTERFFAGLSFINKKIPGRVWSTSQKKRSSCPKGIQIYLSNAFSEERLRTNIFRVLFKSPWCVGLCFAELAHTPMPNALVPLGRKEKDGNIKIHAHLLT